MGAIKARKLYQIDNESLYLAFLSGTHELMRHKTDLNTINVFPVADGDTGTNLAITMNGIRKSAKLLPFVRETFQHIADAVLWSARGNSGTIFAQFISGIAGELPMRKTVTLEEVAISLRSGVRAAYESIENPVEGTIISVMRDWVDAIDAARLKSDEIIEVLSEALHVAVKSLNRTPEKLQVLKERGVVDSGAKGFVIFLHGFMRYLQTGKFDDLFLTDEEEDWEEAFQHVHDGDEQEIKYRYCTEALIAGADIELEELKRDMRMYGDSLVVAGTADKVKLHIHTNEPANCFRDLRKYGQIIEQKAEDMVMQNMVVTKKKYPIALITDTIADLPKSLVDHYQIQQFPLNMHIDESAYLDKITIKADGVYELLKEGGQKISSSQPNRKSIESLYSYLATYYESIIVVTVSKEMSGTYNAFQKVADSFAEKDVPITVINSKVNSAAQGLVVMKAAEAIDTGKTHEEVVAVIEETIEKAAIFVSVDRLEGMIASGRISKTVGVIGKLVNFKPIVSIDEKGQGVLLGKAFSTKSNTEQILKMVKQIQEKDGIERYAIVHGKAQGRLKAFEIELTRIIGKPASFIEEVSSIVASSAGENTIAVALLKE
ncbi:DegV family EDD domain-containing protein [Bacillus sp. AGMB 02131]|uniref:DegV family EDD domain-containing protein n=1 Tax=Peribacillus faecalis TaxID=2772559 RepID=A0A927CUW3_9BACI|nr:DegV family protein [Peribacillus faecalis]MBD3107911.1 DegV family EDD domain-containing protein [Peribacillus faecalis]